MAGQNQGWGGGRLHRGRVVSRARDRPRSRPVEARRAHHRGAGSVEVSPVHFCWRCRVFSSFASQYRAPHFQHLRLAWPPLVACRAVSWCIFSVKKVVASFSFWLAPCPSAHSSKASEVKSPNVVGQICGGSVSRRKRRRPPLVQRVLSVRHGRPPFTGRRPSLVRDQSIIITAAHLHHRRFKTANPPFQPRLRRRTCAASSVDPACFTSPRRMMTVSPSLAKCRLYGEQQMDEPQRHRSGLRSFRLGYPRTPPEVPHHPKVEELLRPEGGRYDRDGRAQSDVMRAHFRRSSYRCRWAIIDARTPAA